MLRPAASPEGLASILPVALVTSVALGLSLGWACPGAGVTGRVVCWRFREAQVWFPVLCRRAAEVKTTRQSRCVQGDGARNPPGRAVLRA